jgi:hypothetical protein
MAEDILLKVRLDTTGARRDLATLYGDMARAPRTSVGAAGGGSGGSAGGSVPVVGGGGGSGGGGGGGFSLGPILAKLTALISAQQMIGSAGPALAASGRDALRESILSGGLGHARGALGAREEVAGRLGPAYGLGLISKERLQSQFDLSMKYGAGMRAKGTAQARAALAGSVAGTIGSESAALAADAVPILGEILGIGKQFLDHLNGGGK